MLLHLDLASNVRVKSIWSPQCPPCVDSFYILSVDKNTTFFDPLPPSFFPYSYWMAPKPKSVLVGTPTLSLWLHFGIFFPKKVFETNLNFRFQRVRNQKNKDTFVISTFKIDITKVALFFLGFFHWCLKLRIVSNNFLDKNSQKQPLCLFIARASVTHKDFSP